jgi:hypothetical protein
VSWDLGPVASSQNLTFENLPGQLKSAMHDLALAIAGDSVLTKGQSSTSTTGVVTSVSPLLVRVGIAVTATTCRNEMPGYTPTVDDVVTVTRQGRRQSITGRSTT